MSTTASRHDLAAVGLAISLLAAAAAPTGAQSVATSAATAPPVAPRIPKIDTLHGEIRVDDYFWLRHKSDTAVIRYLEAENAWTEAGLGHTKGLQEQLYKEILGRVKETDVQVPAREHGYFYYTRTEQGKGYPIYARRKGALTAPEEVIFDQNAAAAGRKYHALGGFVPSPTGRYLAYLEDTTAFRDYTLYVKDLGTGRLVDSITSTATRTLWNGIAWADDEHTLFYLTADSAKRGNAVWRHGIGTSPTGDVKVFQEDDVLDNVGVERSRSGKWIFIADDGFTSSEWRAVPTAAPASPPRVIAPRRPNVEYSVDHGDGYFYLYTNDGAKNFKVLRAPDAASGELRWTEWLAHRDTAFVEGIDVFRRWAVVQERSGGLRRLRVTNLATNTTHYVDFPEAAYAVFPSDNREFDTPTFRFTYSSLVTPISVYDYDLARRTRVLLKRQEIPSGFDASKYEVRRVMAPARDGVRVPVSILLRRGTRLDAGNPLLLYAYGSYGYTMEPAFNSAVLSLVDRGFVYAIAHIRGGQEMGRQWYDDGKMMRKRNTFTDFIDVAESLVKERYTRPDRLVANGGSAGGLLMGAVANMRPDLFRAIVADVPFVDVINTMMDASLPLTAQEWQQWGDPHDSTQYAYMRSYSPYDNVARQAYPWMLVTTSLNDSQVMYWEPAKWVAKLRALKTDSNPLYFKINLAGGHGGSSGRYDRMRETAFRYAFMLEAVGLNAPRP